MDNSGISSGGSNLVNTGILPFINNTYQINGVLNYNKPNDMMLDKYKFANDGEYFLQYGRYVIRNFYNQPYPFFLNPSISLGISDMMVRNFMYYFGEQSNESYKYEMQMPGASSFTAPFVPDQRIRTLIEHMVGKIRSMIESVEDSMSVKSLDYETVKVREAFRRKIEIKLLIDPLMQDNPVLYAPEGVAKVTTQEEADAIVDKYRTKLENACLKLVRGIYYEEELKLKFEDAAVNQLVGNFCQIVIEVIGDALDIRVTPCYNAIIDNRTNGDFGQYAEVGGYVTSMTPSEIFSRYPKVFESEKNQKFINTMAKSLASNWQGAYDFYNLNNIRFWDNSTGKVAVAKVFFLAQSNLRYNVLPKGKTGLRARFLDDDPLKKRHVNTPEGQLYIPSEDIAGDDWSWKWHQVDIIGNAIVANYGYVPYQVLSSKKGRRPSPPFTQYVHRNYMGFFKSFVARLSAHSDKKESLRRKIQEMQNRDMGKVYAIYADKLAAAGIDPLTVFEDFKSMGVAIIGVDGEPGSLTNAKGLVAEELDFSLQHQISQYINMLVFEDKMMDDITNLPPSVLGTQDKIVGKGVQEQTINQSQYSTLSLYKGFETFMQNTCQLALNIEKMRRADSGEEEIIQISPTDAEIIQIDKKDKYQELGIFFEPLDEIEQSNKGLYSQILQSYSQNASPEGAEAILNILKLMKAKSFNEGISMLQQFVDTQKIARSNEEKAMAEHQGQVEQQSIQMQQDFQIAMKKLDGQIKMNETMFKEEQQNFRTEFETLAKNFTSEMERLLKLHDINTSKEIAQMQIEAQPEPA